MKTTGNHAFKSNLAGAERARRNAHVVVERSRKLRASAEKTIQQSRKLMGYFKVLREDYLQRQVSAREGDRAR